MTQKQLKITSGNFQFLWDFSKSTMKKLTHRSTKRSVDCSLSKQAGRYKKKKMR